MSFLFMIFSKLLDAFKSAPKPVEPTLEQKLHAFREMIAWSEIGNALMSVSDNGYNVIVGSTPRNPKLFQSYADHPQQYVAKLNSTAAGRYQFIKKTWLGCKEALNLPDFSPASQDKACDLLVKNCGVYPMLNGNNIDAAIVACSKEWASLAGSTSGQHQFSLETLRGVYQQKLADITGGNK